MDMGTHSKPGTLTHRKISVDRRLGRPQSWPAFIEDTNLLALKGTKPCINNNSIQFNGV
jgi:hypothetical protein